METAALISLSLILMVSVIYNVLDYKVIKSLQAKLEEDQNENLLGMLFCEEIKNLSKGNGDDIPYPQEDKSVSQVIEELNILFPSVGDFWGDRVYSMDATFNSLSKAIISGFTWKSEDAEYLLDIYVLLADMEEEGLIN